MNTIRRNRRSPAGTGRRNRPRDRTRRGNHLPGSIRRGNHLPGSIRRRNHLPGSIRRRSHLPGSIRRRNRPPVSTRPGNRLAVSIRLRNRPAASIRPDSIPAVNTPGSTHRIQVRATPNLQRSTRVRIPAIRIVRGGRRRSIRSAVPTIVRVAINLLPARGTKSMIHASAQRRPPAGSHGPSCRAPVDPRTPTARATSGTAAAARPCACRASRARD